MTPAFDPTPATTSAQWLDLATRLQLERDLADLPALAELLERNYLALLARGDRDPHDSAVRYVTRFDVIDLADTRHKADRTTVDSDRIEPALDPAGLADLARRMGARRLGILPTLESWLVAYEADMLDAGVEHVDPVLDGRSTVTTAAGWLRRHLDWIADQPGSEQLAAEVRDIVEGLAQLGVDLSGPDHSATGTVRELADDLDIPMPTIRAWIARGHLLPLNDTRPRLYARRDLVELRRTGTTPR